MANTGVVETNNIYILICPSFGIKEGLCMWKSQW